MNNLSSEDMDKYLLNQNGHIIHQIWFLDGILPRWKSRKLLNSLKKYQDSWVIKNPSWTYKCWDNFECRNLMKTHFPEHLEMYDKYPYEIQRCDCIRYFILYRYGGLYADMDYCCVKPWDDVIQKFPLDFYVTETPNKLGDEIHVSNSLIYSKPNNPIWKYVFIEMQKNMKMPSYYGRHMTIMYTTGPCIINRIFGKYKRKHNLGFYPYRQFHPYGLTTDLSDDTTKDVYAYHLGKGSWETSDSKLWLFLYRELKIILFIIISKLVLYFLL